MSILNFLNKVMANTASVAANSNNEIGGKTLNQWDRQWQSIGLLRNVQGNISYLNNRVGLYRAKLNGEVVYIGRAIEVKGGLRKRLTDYVRQSDSARGTNSSNNMNLHRDRLQIDVLVVGSDEEAAMITRKLEIMMIGKYRPKWNKQFM